MSNRSIFDILKLNSSIPEDVEVIDREYRAVDIDKVVIDENVYTNYGAYSFIWEKTYVKSPQRSSGGVVYLNSHSTFLTGHFVIDFSVISIDDYRSIMKQHYEKNEFIVKCYDPIYNKTIKLKMYFATEEMAKLYTINKRIWNKDQWEDWIMLAGIQDYKLEMISTNADLDLVGVTYHFNPPADTGLLDQTQGEESVYVGEEIIIGSNSDYQLETFGTKYKFSKWNTQPDGSGVNYMDGYAYTINTDLVLYAQWESQENHILTYNYGLADPSIIEWATTPITNKTVVSGQSIGELPSFENPYVTIDDTKYYPYHSGKWYKLPVKTPNINDFEVSDNDLYWGNRDSSIYLLFDTYAYFLNLYIDGVLYQRLYAKYNSTIAFPELVKSGYTFDGWYTTPDYQEDTKFSGNMPPYNLDLYARWIKQ